MILAQVGVEFHLQFFEFFHELVFGERGGHHRPFQIPQVPVGPSGKARPLDYYKVLQLKPGSSIQEVKQAFRKFAHKYHPDKNHSEDSGNIQKFLKYKEAYEFLSDPFKKMEYDQNLLPKPKKKATPIYHDLSFIKGKIKKKKKNKNIRRGVKKINVKKNQCPVCEGYGFVYNPFQASIRFPSCFGSGRKPAFADQK